MTVVILVRVVRVVTVVTVVTVATVVTLGKVVTRGTVVILVLCQNYFCFSKDNFFFSFLDHQE